MPAFWKILLELCEGASCCWTSSPTFPGFVRAASVLLVLQGCLCSIARASSSLPGLVKASFNPRGSNQNVLSCRLASLSSLNGCVPKLAAAMRSSLNSGALHLKCVTGWLLPISYLEAAKAGSAALAAASPFTQHRMLGQHPAAVLAQEWSALAHQRMLDLLVDLHQVFISWPGSQEEPWLRPCSLSCLPAVPQLGCLQGTSVWYMRCRKARG